MKKQAVKSVAGFAVVLMFLSIIPSCAIASENATYVDQINSANDKGSGKMMSGGMRHWLEGPDGMRGMGFCPTENITEENFTEVQAEVLNSITEKIAELQSLYNNVSETSTAEELQEVLLAERQENAESADPCGKNGFPNKMCGLCLFNVEDLTDENFTEVQTEIVDTLGNMTDILNVQLEKSSDENMTEMLKGQISKLEDLSASVSGASSASELQDVVLTYMKAQAVNSIEKEIEHLEARVSKNENSGEDTAGKVTELKDKITELTALKEDVKGAESFDEFRELSLRKRLSEQDFQDIFLRLPCISEPLSSCICPLPHLTGPLPYFISENIITSRDKPEKMLEIDFLRN